MPGRTLAMRSLAHGRRDVIGAVLREAAAYIDALERELGHEPVDAEAIASLARGALHPRDTVTASRHEGGARDRQGDHRDDVPDPDRTGRADRPGGPAGAPRAHAADDPDARGGTR